MGEKVIGVDFGITIPNFDSSALSISSLASEQYKDLLLIGFEAMNTMSEKEDSIYVTVGEQLIKTELKHSYKKGQNFLTIDMDELIVSLSAKGVTLTNGQTIKIFGRDVTVNTSYSQSDLGDETQEQAVLAKCAEIDEWLMSSLSNRTFNNVVEKSTINIGATSNEMSWANQLNRDIYSYIVLSDFKVHRVKVGDMPATGGANRIQLLDVSSINKAIATYERFNRLIVDGLYVPRNMAIGNTVMELKVPVAGASPAQVLPLNKNVVFENNGELIKVLDPESKGYYYIEVNGDLFPIDDSQYGLMYPGREDIVDEVDLGDAKYLRLVKVSPLKAMIVDGTIDNFDVRLFKTDSPISEAQLAGILPSLDATNSRTLQVTNIIGVDYDEFWSRAKATADSVNNMNFYKLTEEQKLLLYDGVSSVWKYYYDRMTKNDFIEANPEEARKAILDGLVNPWIEYMAYKDVTGLLAVNNQLMKIYGSDNYKNIASFYVLFMSKVGMETSVQKLFPYIQELGNNINGIPINEVYNYVQASQWVYDNYKKGTTIREAELPTGWENITSEFASQANGKITQSAKTGEWYYSDTATGYQAAILKKPNGDLVMVSRGTEFPRDTWNDVVETDLMLGIGINQQLLRSKELYQVVRNNSLYVNSSIIHTGHSLGGANANCTAIWARGSGHTDKSITFDAPGEKEVVKKSIAGFSGSERFDYITNIDVAGDWIGGILDHIDSPRYVIRPKTNWYHGLENFKK